MTIAFEVLPGLPGTGPLPEQFTTHGGTHREGFVVRVTPEAGAPWVGNFQRIAAHYLSAVFLHPDRKRLVIVAGGLPYLVDPATRAMVGTYRMPVEQAIESIYGLILATSIEVVVIDERGHWTSPRVALDGIRGLHLDGRMLVGEGWAGSDDWTPIRIDVEARQVLASAY